MKSREIIFKYALILCLTVLLTTSTLVLICGWIGGHFHSLETLRIYITAMGIWGPLVLTLIQFLQVILPVLPGFMGCIVGAVLFGTAGGFFINYIGISAGSIGAYFLARRFGIPLVERLVPIQKYEKYIERISRSRSYTMLLFFSILLPLAPDDFLCYFSGLIDMPPGKFILIIAAAKPWCILLYCTTFAYFL